MDNLCTELICTCIHKLDVGSVSMRCDSMIQPSCFSLEDMIAQRCEQQESDFFIFFA